MMWPNKYLELVIVDICEKPTGLYEKVNTVSADGVVPTGIYHL